MKKPSTKLIIREKERNCPYCGSKSIIKKEKRTNKFKQVQLYLCKDCNKRFTYDKFKSKTSPIKSMVKALSAYNSGLTIEETTAKTIIPKSTIANWIKEYRYLFNIMYFAGRARKFSKNKKLYVLDYKPGAAKEKPLGQLFVYACCLSINSGIHFVKMRLAWFDDKNYYEVDAMDVYKVVMQSFGKTQKTRKRNFLKT